MVGIELLNEPLTPVLNGGIEGTKQYYTQGYNAVRGSFGGSIPFSDGFVQPSEWNGFLTGQNTIVNHHEYQVFTNELLQLDYQGHVDKVYSSAAEWASGADKPVVNGEWTAAMTDCAPALVCSLNRLVTPLTCIEWLWYRCPLRWNLLPPQLRRNLRVLAIHRLLR